MLAPAFLALLVVVLVDVLRSKAGLGLFEGVRLGAPAASLERTTTQLKAFEDASTRSSVTLSPTVAAARRPPDAQVPADEAASLSRLDSTAGTRAELDFVAHEQLVDSFPFSAVGGAGEPRWQSAGVGIGCGTTRFDAKCSACQVTSVAALSEAAAPIEQRLRERFGDDAGCVPLQLRWFRGLELVGGEPLRPPNPRAREALHERLT